MHMCGVQGGNVELIAIPTSQIVSLCAGPIMFLPRSPGSEPHGPRFDSIVTRSMFTGTYPAGI